MPDRKEWIEWIQAGNRQVVGEKKECCPDCGCRLDADWHATVHEMWEVGQANKQRDEPETMTVEVIYQGKRYKGVIPCVGIDE